VLSLHAGQLRLIWFVEAAVAVSEEGELGGVTSAVTADFTAEKLP